MNEVGQAFQIGDLLEKALALRQKMLATGESNALRLFAGFYEGFPGLVVDLYEQTLLLFDYRENSSYADPWMDAVQQFYLARLPQITCVVRKPRSIAQNNGMITYGEMPSMQVIEYGICYAVDLMLNRDASFYLDMRNLRNWLLKNSRDQSVLNTFAYTGSLGVAALAGGAQAVVQTDLNRNFLALARTSCMLNHLDLGKMKLHAQDFFSEVAWAKRNGHLFDLVILDPPFFSTTQKGRVDQLTTPAKLINKVRPLVKDGGKIIAANNSLFLSGEAYMQTLEDLSTDGYLSIGHLIPVPEDVTGFSNDIVSGLPVSPAPFNHPTKIAVLNVRRK